MKTKVKLGKLRSYYSDDLQYSYPSSLKRFFKSYEKFDDSHEIDIRDILESIDAHTAWESADLLSPKARSVLCLRADSMSSHIIFTNKYFRSASFDEFSTFEVAFESMKKIIFAVAYADVGGDILLDLIKDCAWTRLGKILRQWCDEQDPRS